MIKTYINNIYSLMGIRDAEYIVKSAKKATLSKKITEYANSLPRNEQARWLDNSIHTLYVDENRRVQLIIVYHADYKKYDIIAPKKTAEMIADLTK